MTVQIGGLPDKRGRDLFEVIKRHLDTEDIAFGGW